LTERLFTASTQMAPGALRRTGFDTVKYLQFPSTRLAEISQRIDASIYPTRPDVGARYRRFGFPLRIYVLLIPLHLCA
jgi:hypothetical protein